MRATPVAFAGTRVPVRVAPGPLVKVAVDYQLTPVDNSTRELDRLS